MKRNLDELVEEAVEYFWETRMGQAEEQRDSQYATRGGRAAVLGGQQMSGFAELVTDLLIDKGVPEDSIHYDHGAEIPGFFRVTKRWDIVVVDEGELLAAIELKSQVGPSFGNNLNNRTEEAIGNSTDLHTAYREGAFEPSAKPWVGYVMLLEDDPDARSPVNIRSPHFDVFEEFEGASYAERYRLLLERLVREQLYDAAAFMMSGQDEGLEGGYTEPDDELTFRRFAADLRGHIEGHISEKTM